MARPLSVIILAAGKGTRMKSDLPKVLHRLLGRPLLGFPLAIAQTLGPAKVVVVIGHGAEAVRASLPPAVDTAVQAEQRGTADALRVGLTALGDFDGDVLVLSGDVPRLRRETCEALLGAGGRMALVSALAPTPKGYGRLVRGADGRVARIVEERDASPSERALREINAGLYRFDAAFLRANLPRLSAANAQGELYLTDLVALAASEGVGCVRAELEEVAGINDRCELAAAAAALRRELNAQHQRAGVTMIDPGSVYLDLSVQLGRDVVLEPGCVLTGSTVVGEGTVVRSHSVLEDAQVGPGCALGPFARLRPGTVLAAGVHLGNFVETKNARLGEGSKANHLSYLGDADIGRKVNVGAGTITCNYDGEKKHLTRIGDGAFIGSDTQLVAPVAVGAGAYVAAGSTVTADVPENSLVLTRAPTVVKEGWATQLRARRAAAKSEGGKA